MTTLRKNVLKTEERTKFEEQNFCDILMDCGTNFQVKNNVNAVILLC